MAQSESDIIIGIDLGTTNSEVALIRGGKVEVLEVENGHKQLPSYVALGENGELLVGETARNQYPLFPERTVKSIKRHMGSDEKVQLGEQQFTPQEISAMILRRLKQVAEAACGCAIERAIITVPAFFSDVQRQATRDAGEIAGLKVERIINEPTAAALAYECNQKQAKNILVYDLGGGTFDVSVVHIDSGVVEVRASHGDNHLGGDDFDHRLLEHICRFIEDEHGVDARDSTRAMSRINRAAETAKIALSSQPYYTVEEEYLLEKDGVPIHLSLEISRDEYEAMIADYIDQTLEAVHTALDGAGLRALDIDEILLVGGSTRTPLVQERLEAEMGMQPRLELDPDLCVAMGAAVQAGMMGGTKIGPILVDITPYTFGTSAIDEFKGMSYPYCFIPLIRKNTPIPVTHSESFYTAYDGQKAIEVKVYQGEDKDALNNTEIGSFLLEIQGNLPAGSPIVTTFSLDINGILNVSTLEKKSGHTQHLTIDNALSHFQENEMEQAKTALQKLMAGDDYDDEDDDIDEIQETRERVKDKALLEKAKNILPLLEGDDREDAVDLIEALDLALRKDDVRALKMASDELSDFLYYISPDLGAKK